jgi:phosphoribosylformylglycinamidine (FGAM) synthase-like enzyme
VTGGNVSLYNESPTGAVYPTPIIGMVGVVESLAHVTRSTFHVDGDAIVLLGDPTDEIGASEYLARVHGVVAGAPPACDLDRERALIDALLDVIAAGAIHSAHDCSDGGLAVALAECAIGDADAPLGAEVDLSTWSALPLRALLFGEAQGRVVVSTADPDGVIATAAKHGVPARRIGTVRATSSALVMRVGSRSFSAPLARLAAAYHDAIPNIMSRATGETAVLEQHPQPSAS